MTAIDISVTNRRAYASGMPHVVCGNSDYLLRFTLDAEWNDVDGITAQIGYIRNGKPYCETAPITNGQCEMPAVHGAHEIAVGVTGGSVRTAIPARIQCIPCITDIPGEPQIVRNDVYNTLMRTLNQILSPVKSGIHQTLAAYTNAELARSTHAELAALGADI